MTGKSPVIAMMSTPEPNMLPVTCLTGIGSQTAARLQKIGIHCLQDLLFHLPFRYQDRSRVVPIAQLRSGMSVLTCGNIEFTESIQRGKSSLICRINDGSGMLSIRFFHFSAHQATQLKPGLLLGCYGEIRYGYNGLEMVHPEYKIVDSTGQLTENTLRPVYPVTEGLSQTTLRKIIKQAINLCLQNDSGITDWMPEEILQRQPFPGPGLAVRVLGEVTPERLALLRECDDVVVSEIKNAGLYTKIWQSFAVLLPVMSVGVMGDMRTYAYTCAVRAVSSEDGMTADWVALPHEVLKTISSRIVNEVKGVNRVVYDITSKPPGTIEWE